MSGEFRERVRNRLPICLPGSYEGMKSLCATLTDTVIEALDRLDRAEAINKDSLRACEELVRFCESKERTGDEVCPNNAYELAKAVVSRAKQ